MSSRSASSVFAFERGEELRVHPHAQEEQIWMNTLTTLPPEEPRDVGDEAGQEHGD
jgi:hypothetical protein